MLEYLNYIFRKDMEALMISAAQSVVDGRAGTCPLWIPALMKFKVRYYDAFNHLCGDRLDASSYYGDDARVCAYQDALRLKKEKSFFEDRINEYLEIFPTQSFEGYDKKTLMQRIESYGCETDEALFNALSAVAPVYFFRKMAMPNYTDLMNFDQGAAAACGQKVMLDYGCGAADVALYASRQGYDVTVCDVKGANLDAATKRFALRNIIPEIIPVTAMDPVPDLEEKKFDIINAVEVIEHVRDPVRLMNNLYNALKPDGVLVVGSFPFTDTNTRGDHLEESVGKREVLLKMFETQYYRIEETKCFKKRA